MNGVKHIRDLINVVREKTDHEIDYRLLVTMYNPDNVAGRAIKSKLDAEYQGHMLKTHIEYDPKIPESQISRKPVIYYDRHSKAANQYLDLAKELVRSF